MFHLFFGLISAIVGLALALILLPFRLLVIPIAAAGISLRVILRLFARNVVWFAIIAIALVIYTFLPSKSVQKSTAQSTTTAGAPVGKGGPIVIDRVTKHENGDSNFATDIYAMMTEPERAYYSYVFYWAMSNLQDGQASSWSHYNIAGTLQANDHFLNNSGVTCRHFSEILKVHQIEQTLTGTACAQSGNAWCKLKPNATAACDLGGNEGGGVLDSVTGAIRGLF